MQTPSNDLPQTDEAEVTLLGRGTGESCIVHLGGHRWMIVDSFMTARPVTRHIAGRERSTTLTLPGPQSYLDRLYEGSAVSPLVEAIVITHFHRDHYQGVLQLHSFYGQARLIVTEAVGLSSYAAVFGAQAQGSLARVGQALKNARARTFGSAGLVEGLRKVHVGDDVIAPKDGAHVVAIAPTDAACNEADANLARVFDGTPNARTVTNQLEDDNLTSIALHVTTCGSHVLLGGDVVDSPKRFGWDAAVTNAELDHLDPASIAKVPHHGGSGAHHDPMWDRFVERGSPMLLAPFWNKSVPSQDQQQMLSARGRLYQAAPSSARVTTQWVTTGKQSPSMGVIQARRRPGGPWTIGVADPAHEVI